MEFRKASAEDEDALMAIIDEAKAYFHRQGIDQWQKGYPNRETLRADRQSGAGWVLVRDGIPVAYSAVIFGVEPTYRVLENGAWLREGPYVVVHRTCVREDRKGQGLAGRLLGKVADMAWANGVRDLRIDTHMDNRSMRHMLEKNGFSARGIIHLADGDPRVAYEKALG